MSKITLPVSDPLINTSNAYGTLFSIISSDNRIWPWVYSNFIQLRYVTDWETYFFDNHELLVDYCPFLNKFILPRTIISKWSSFTDFVVDSINGDCYVWCHLDRYFISAYQEFGKEHRFHETLIYGYDLDRQTVCIRDNITGGKFMTAQCTFSELESAFDYLSGEENFITRVTLLSKIDAEFDLNVEQIVDSLQRYLSSKRSFDFINHTITSIYGQSVYQHLIYQMEHPKEDDPELDIRAYHLLWEHKKLMVLRLKYLQQIKLLLQSDRWIERCTELEERSLLNRNMVLRYNLSMDPKVLDALKHSLLTIQTDETKLLGEIISALGSKG
ncbi:MULTISPECIES: hypothetical protein [Paenibacillus]|uniref:hypothetical protein n=1 Tax=Paenibacillus TaxID=44249 RepID=UPI00096FBBE2|nr:hypothetical protein [Paenibacillus odorifer]OMD24676.1 hypothetical protein BJP48_25045 [Paenibacillus odorifer]OME48920.1 hypothetical protein BSK61_24200 [Paenibacillus odorifer]